MAFHSIIARNLYYTKVKMALIQVSYCLIDDVEIFNILCDSFEKIEEVKDEPLYRTKTLRVQHEEITTEDKVIIPSMYRFDGVRPFIIKWDCD